MYRKYPVVTFTYLDAPHLLGFVYQNYSVYVFGFCTVFKRFVIYHHQLLLFVPFATQHRNLSASKWTFYTSFQLLRMRTAQNFSAPARLIFLAFYLLTQALCIELGVHRLSVKNVQYNRWREKNAQPNLAYFLIGEIVDSNYTIIIHTKQNAIL